MAVTVAVTEAETVAESESVWRAGGLEAVEKVRFRGAQASSPACNAGVPPATILLFLNGL